MAEGVSIRPMKLKILYTFDQNNSTHCLARWPHVVDVRTASLDDSTQIGVIDLKTCIQAVTTASPELTARPGQDYTVYAFDYSEYDTPLVGQGKLSSIISASSVPSTAPCSLVTGRVSKNMLSLLSNSPQEILEVKLRLVPLPYNPHKDDLDNLRATGELNKTTDFDSDAWTTLMSSNPPFGQSANSPGLRPVHRIPPQRTGSGMEIVQNILSEAASPMDFHDSEFLNGLDNTASYPPYTDSRHPSRTASPAFANQRRPSLGQNHISPYRPSSPVRNASEMNDEGFDEGPSKKRAKLMKADWPIENNLGQQPESLRVAASTAASIRVHRPTPIRVSTERRGSNSNLENTPRAPTPIPTSSIEMPRRSRTATASGLRYESSEPQDYRRSYSSIPHPPKPDSFVASPEKDRSVSNNNTPTDIPSSPPVIRTSPCPSSPQLPPLRPGTMDSGFMSGSLDDLFDDDDEMRPIDEEDLEVAAQYKRRNNHFPFSDKPSPAEVRRPSTGSVKESHASTQCAWNTGHEQPVSHNSPCNGNNQVSNSREITPTSRPGSSASASTTAPCTQPVAPYTRTLARTQSAGCLPLSQVPASDPVLPGNRQFQRAQSTCGVLPPLPASEASAPTALSIVNNTAFPHVSSGARRKQVIKDNLQKAIENGEMPTYCHNCGTLDPPTWRKAYVRLHSGSTEKVKISNEPCGIIACEILKRNDKGDVELFRIIKKNLYPGETGFEQIYLCNPCGLWLQKTNSMRPRDKWNRRRRDPESGRKRKKGGKDNDSADGGASTSTKNNRRQSTTSRNMDSSSPADAENGRDENEEEQSNKQSNRSRSRPASSRRKRANSTEPGSGDGSSKRSRRPTRNAQSQVFRSTTGTQRAVQSSPVHKSAKLRSGLGNNEHDPIEIEDLTPKPIKRLLFPSPRKPGESKGLDDGSFSVDLNANDDASPSPKDASGDETPRRRSPRHNKIQNQVSVKSAALLEVTEAKSVNISPCRLPAIEEKENVPPTEVCPQSPVIDATSPDLSYLFEYSKSPSTPPPPNRTSLSTVSFNLFKTPPSNHSVDCSKQSQPPLTPLNNGQSNNRLGELTPFTAHLTQLLSDANAQSSPMGMLMANGGLDFEVGNENGLTSFGSTLGCNTEVKAEVDEVGEGLD